MQSALLLRALALPAPLLVAAGLLAGNAAAEWTRGDSGPTREATVTGDLSGSLTVYCPFNDLGAPAALLVTGTTFPESDQLQSESVRMDFSVDGGAHTLTGTYDGELHYQATDRAEFERLSALIEALRVGERLQIDVSALNWSETFTLKGSDVALEGILKGCEPK